MAWRSELIITATWPSWRASAAAGRSAVKGYPNLGQSTFQARRRLWSNHRGVARTRYDNVRLKMPELAIAPGQLHDCLSSLLELWLGEGRERGADLETGGVFLYV